MADVSVSGLDELIAAMRNADLFDEQTVSEMLCAGANAVQDEIRMEMHKSRYHIQGMEQKVGYSMTIKKNRNGEPYVTVRVAGKNANGEKNSTVLFVLNYGRQERYGRIAGDFFWTKATKRATKTASAAVEKIAEKKLKERGLL